METHFPHMIVTGSNYPTERIKGVKYTHGAKVVFDCGILITVILVIVCTCGNKIYHSFFWLFYFSSAAIIKCFKTMHKQLNYLHATRGPETILIIMGFPEQENK